MIATAGGAKPLFTLCRLLSVLLLAVTPSVALGQGTLELETLEGVVSEQPSEGRYVEVDGVFLVPYEARIPGTNIHFTMEPIVGGKVLLGNRGEEGSPAVEVNLAPYWIARCEVTWGEYRQYMALCNIFEKFEDRHLRTVTDANRVDAITAPSKIYDPSFTFMSGNADNLPAVSMSQYAAKQYTKWLSLLTSEFYRLPSEAEWEHACRAGTETLYSFGDEADQIDAYAWYEDNADYETMPVAQKKPNPWGLYDMHGNVCEWVLDAYDEAGLAVLREAQPPEGEPPVNWPTKLYPRVLRGGSVISEAEDCQSSARRGSNDKELRTYDPNTPKSPWWFASEESQDIGFRIVRPYHVPDRERQSLYWDADVARIQKIADHRIDNEGKGERGIVDPDLPAAIQSLKKKR